MHLEGAAMRKRNGGITRTATAATMVLVAALLACGGGGIPREMKAPVAQNVSLVYGYLDMSDAPTDVDWVDIKQMAPPTEKPYRGARVDDGAFYSETLPPGSYMISGFGGSSFWHKGVIYDISRQGAPIRVRIQKPGMYFLGSWKVTQVDTGFFEAPKFEVQRVGSPTEREVLEKMLPEAEGTWWEGQIKRRLAAL